jgi:hypothetical protein
MELNSSVISTRVLHPPEGALVGIAIGAMGLGGSGPAFVGATEFAFGGCASGGERGAAIVGN